MLEALRSGRLGLGPKMEEFESLLATFTGNPWAQAVSSGTAGLHLAVRVLGIGAGDCVLMSSFSFISSANAVRYEGAQPVFLDIEEPSLCLAPSAIEGYLATCTREADGSLRDLRTGLRVAGVISTDVFGYPADIDSIIEVLTQVDANIPLISDSCEALGTRSVRADGSTKHAGRGAAMSVFAFYPNKQITTGEGGMVVGDDLLLRDAVHGLRNQGRAPDDAWLRHTDLGYNYRLDELSCALGVAQMRRVEEILRKRAQVTAWYEERLEGVEEVITPRAGDGAMPAWFVEFLRVAPSIDRAQVIAALDEQGIQAKAYFDIPIHRQPPYDGQMDLTPTPLPVTDAAAASVMVVPYFSTMSEAQVDQVCTELRQVLRGAA